MSEFQSRIEAQRNVLGNVNSYSWNEELMGLSRKSIDRWLAQNGLSLESELAALLAAISAKLFFLSNKSQQQVTDEYRSNSLEVSKLTEALRDHLSNEYVGN